MKLKLSISVLVSDRTDTADKCLKSLVPILKEIPSELIVVYTGTNPLSLEIARKYTENIIPFTWCNDFSKARNVGLKKSSGEWFMFIDDDEWFEDCEEIISFFKYGEYNKYNSAFYRIRNYIDINGTEYADTSAGRLVKRTDKTEFEGIVHEHIKPWLNPIKYFQCYVHHYGYVAGDANRKIDNSERNVPLLLKQIELEPDNIQSRVQLVQEYHRLKRYKEAENEGRYVLKQIGEKNTGLFYQWTAVEIIRVLIEDNRKYEALEEGQKLLFSNNFSELYMLNIYAALIPVCLELKKYKEGAEYAREYICVKDKLEAVPSLWDEQQLLAVNRSNTIKESYYVYLNGIICATYIQEFELAGYFLKTLMNSGNDNRDHMYQFLEKWFTLFPANEDEILSVYCDIESENPYVNLQKALYYERNGEKDKINSFYEKCQSESNLIYIHKVVLLAVRNGFDLPEQIENMDLNDWKACAQRMTDLYDVERFFADRDTINTLFSEYSLQKAVLLQKIFARIIYDKNIELPVFISSLSEYCKTVLEINRLLYREEIFEPAMSFCLPKECRAAIKIQKVLDEMNYAETAGLFRSLKELVHDYPNLNHIAGRIMDYITFEYIDNPDRAGSNEFKETGQKVKEIMKQLANDEKYAEAMEVANRLSELLPDDLEVVKYKLLLRKMIQ